MSDKGNGEQPLPPVCRNVWNTIRICEGDMVEVYIRGLRVLAGVRGKVKRITDAGLVIETEENDTAVRYSEIRMIRRLKNGGRK